MTLRNAAGWFLSVVFVMAAMWLRPAHAQGRDLEGDKKIDIVCIGTATANVKWYENVGSK